MRALSTEIQESVSALAGKYLSFRLDQEEYGIPLLKVQEIIGLMAVTKVPHAPEFIRGVINLRGKIIPVLELRTKFGMAQRPDTDRTSVIVVRVEREGVAVTMGLIVDDVSEVLEIKASQLEAPPDFGTLVSASFILAMAKIGTRVVVLLDIDQVLSRHDLAETQIAVGSGD